MFNMKVLDVFGVHKTDGEVGIEIELEGTGIGELAVAGWRTEYDGSLRGEAIELVLAKPIPRDQVTGYVERIVDAVEAAEAEVIDSGRAGVHIHINMQQNTIKELFNTICAYMIFEEVLIDFCGEHRVGNLFCLRVKDAEHMLMNLREAVRSVSVRELGNNSYRYASMNTCSLARFGSLEFRAMRSTIDPVVLNAWTQMLLHIKDWACTFDNPQHLITEFSLKGPDVVCEEVLGEYVALLNPSQESLYEGVRNAQYVAFSTDNWDVDDYEEFLNATREWLNKDTDFRYLIEHLHENPRNYYQDRGAAKEVMRCILKMDVEDYADWEGEEEDDENEEEGWEDFGPEEELHEPDPVNVMDPVVFRDMLVVPDEERGLNRVQEGEV